MTDALAEPLSFQFQPTLQPLMDPTAWSLPSVELNDLLSRMPSDFAPLYPNAPAPSGYYPEQFTVEMEHMQQSSLACNSTCPNHTTTAPATSATPSTLSASSAPAASSASSAAPVETYDPKEVLPPLPQAMIVPSLPPLHQTSAVCMESCAPHHPPMESFPPESLQDFKHVLYNMLVDNYNHPTQYTFVLPCSVEIDGAVRHGFRFNSRQSPEKKIPELYAQHIRKARLDWEDQSSVFIQDLYKYYLRACVELLSKYFSKKDKYTYLYDDIPLFVPGESLEVAEERIKTMKTRARKRRRAEAAKNNARKS